MIDKILWASDGSNYSTEALKYVELLAKKFKTEILGLHIIQDYHAVAEKLSSEKKNKFIKWIEDTRSKERERLEDIAKDFKEKGISFRMEITTGIPYKEILRVADRENVDLIALGRGRSFEKFILGGTALKVLRESSLPVLTVGEGRKSLDIKSILVPTDLLSTSRLSEAFRYAAELSNEFGATIYSLNVVEIGDYNFPIDVIKQIREFSFRELEENLSKIRGRKNIETFVEVANNIWGSIVKFANEKDIDLIVMMTYSGKRFSKDFISSVAERVIQGTSCPIITIKP
ncbi:MAG: universal stress protein [Deltaproteobacteria bacterium]|nr:universal stress protein [Deltaproteobacteria bacterium]